jgi:hypothetical protein
VEDKDTFLETALSQERKAVEEEDLEVIGLVTTAVTVATFPETARNQGRSKEVAAVVEEEEVAEEAVEVEEDVDVVIKKSVYTH